MVGGSSPSGPTIKSLNLLHKGCLRNFPVILGGSRMPGETDSFFAIARAASAVPAFLRGAPDLPAAFFAAVLVSFSLRRDKPGVTRLSGLRRRKEGKALEAVDRNAPYREEVQRFRLW